jgi:hypothetical protein
MCCKNCFCKLRVRWDVALLGLVLFLCSIVCGCSDGKSYYITYANHSGMWVTGTITVNDDVRDSFDKMPFTDMVVTMHPRHSSGRKFDIVARDIFSGDEINISGYTPKVPAGLGRPNLVIEYLGVRKVRTQWVDDSKFLTVDLLKDRLLSEMKVIPVVCTQNNDHGMVQVALRQRPRLFATKWGKIADERDGGLSHLYAFNEMIDPRRSPEMVIFFEAEDEQGEVVTWRDVVDCRQVVGAPEEGAMFWIEIGREGEYRLGWGQSNERDLRQLRRLLDENALMEPQQWWTGRAKQHPKLPVYSLHSRQTYDFPDLRFDDEIQQQMQQAGR